MKSFALQSAENQGFTFDELELSLRQNGGDPLHWLHDTWHELVAKVLSVASQAAEEPVYSDVSETRLG